MILYESTNMQPFHVFIRESNHHYSLLFNENQAQNRAFGRLYVRRRWTTAT